MRHLPTVNNLIVLLISLAAVSCGGGSGGAGDGDQGSPAATALKVLFIGNSYTSSNNLPSLVTQIASSKNQTIETTAVTPGGTRFSGHAAANSGAMNAINSEQWDFVILQNQSQVPGWKPADVTTLSLPHAETLVNAIQANNAATQIIYFVTWGRENGDAGNCSYYPTVCTFSGHTSALLEGYGIYQASTGGKLAVAGPAWKAVVDDASAPFDSGELWSGDGSHPDLLGSYLTASVLFTAMFSETPLGADAPAGISAAHASYLQQIAADQQLNSAAIANGCPDLSVLSLSAANTAFTESSSNDSACAATAALQASIDHGTIASGSINALGDEDWYLINVTADAHFSFSTMDCPVADTALEIYDSNMALVAQNDDFDGSLCSNLLVELAAGTYAIRVDAADELSSSLGTYELKVDQLYPYKAHDVEPNDTWQTADTYRDGWVTNITADDEDILKVEITSANSTIIAEVTDLHDRRCVDNDGNFYTSMNIYDSAGTLIEFGMQKNGGDACGRVVSDPLPVGTYYVTVFEDYEDYPYMVDELVGIKIQIVDSLTSEVESNDTLALDIVGHDKGSDLIPGDIIKGTIDSAGQEDYFSFIVPDSGNASTSSHLTIFKKVEGSIHVTMYDTDAGAALGSSTQNFNAWFADQQQNFTSGGKRYFKINTVTMNATGDYTLSYNLNYRVDIVKTKPVFSLIPDGIFSSSTELQSTLSISESCTGAGTIEALKIDMDMTHTQSRDLSITLTSPSATIVELKANSSTDKILGVYGVDINTSEPLSAFRGETITGDWVLTIEDNSPNDQGILNLWKLDFICQP